MRIRLKIIGITFFLLLGAIAFALFAVQPILIKKQQDIFYSEIEMQFNLFENDVQSFMTNAEHGIDLLLKNEKLLSDPTSYSSYLTMVKDGVFNNPNSDELDIMEDFQSYKNSTLYTEFIYVGFTNGAFIMNEEVFADAAPGEHKDNFDSRKRPWYEAAIAQPGQIVLADIYDARDDSVAVNTIPYFSAVAKTFSDENDNILGVIGMDIVFTDFLKEFDMPNYLDYGKHGIIQGENIILYSTNDAISNDNSLDNDYEILNVENAFKGIDLSALQEGDFSHNTQDINGVESVVFLYNIKDVNMVFIQVIPLSEIVSVVGVIINPVIYIFSFFFIFLAIVLYAAINFIFLKPLEGIKIKTDLVAAENDFTIQFETKYNDEIGAIGASFNSMLSEIRSKTNNMQIRIKELNCLYNVSKVARRAETIEEMFLSTCEYIKEGWQHPDFTRVKITFNDKEYQIEEFDISEFVLSANIVSKGIVAGKIEVFYIEDSPKTDDDLFLEEEKQLLIAITQTINLALASEESKSDLLKLNNTFEQELINRTKELNKLVSAIEQNPNLIIITNEQGIVEYVNDIVFDMIGYTKKELIGKSNAHIEALDEKHLTDKDWEDLRSGKTLIRERINTRKDGSEFWSRTTIAQVYDSDKTEIGYVSTKEDISEKKEQEEEIKLINQLSDSALELSKSGYWTIDLKDPNYVIGTERSMKMLGEEPVDGRLHLVDEWAKHIRDVSIEEERKLVDVYAKALSGETESYDATYPYKRPIDGKISWIRSIANVIRNDAGEPLMMHGVNMDITEVKTKEIELKEARLIAEQATKSKSDFLANMSHEIRTPMNAVIGLTRLLDNTDLNLKQLDYVTKIGRAATNLLGIINDILDFSKIEAGKMSIESTEFDINDVLDNLTSVIGAKAFDKGIEFIISKNFTLESNLIGDPLRLGQIILNLVNNAIKFTSKGQVYLQVLQETIDDKKTSLKFSVVDSGIGMTEDQVSKLFKAFSQADTSTTRKYGGTGLGLSISKNLVEQMGGAIGVTSVYNEGSKFFFTLEFSLGETIKRKRMVIPERIKDIKVMVVDDNQVSLEVIEDYLDSYGIQSQLVNSGERAIEVIDETIDLVILDWKMPGLNGGETWIKLKDKLKTNIPKVVILTAYGKQDIIDTARNIGIETVLMKPISKSTLYDQILTAFGEEVNKSTKTNNKIYVEGFENIKGAKILVAEDNEINQQVIQETLELEGFIVDIANNGQLAYDMHMANEDYDIILMDLQMPIMGGYEATKKIREAGFNALPIVALTADAMTGVYDKVIKTGMNDMVAKPIDLKELYTTLVKHIEPKEREVNIINKSDDSIVEDFTILEYRFNVEKALERTANNTKLYKSIIKKYSINYKEFIKYINEEMQKDSEELILRELHTIKGLSGNIGATETNRLCKVVESHYKMHHNFNNLAEYKNLEDSIKNDVEIISMYLEQFSEKDDDTAILSKPDILEKLELIKQYLEEYDTKCKAIIEEILPSLKNLNITNGEKMFDNADNYDFDEALEICLEIIIKMEEK